MYGRYYPEAESKETLTTKGFAKHVSEHGGTLVNYEFMQLVLASIVKCLKEMMSQGQPVKLDGLGTFRPTITSVKNGAASIEEALTKGVNNMVAGVNFTFLPENAQGEKITSKKFKDQCSLQISIHRRVVVGCEQVVTDVVFEHGDANLSGGLVGGGDGARTHGLVDIGGLVDGVVHLHIDGVGGGEGGQVLWCLAGRTEAIAEEEAYEAGGWNGDVPSHAVA